MTGKTLQNKLLPVGWILTLLLAGLVGYFVASKKVEKRYSNAGEQKNGQQSIDNANTGLQENKLTVQSERFVALKGKTFLGADCGQTASVVFTLPDPGIEMEMPCGYDLHLPSPWSWHRHGSFIYYEPHPRGNPPSPVLSEIHFLNVDSVPLVEEKCYDLCIETVTRNAYLQLEEAWKNNTPFPDRQERQLGNHRYLIKNNSSLGDEYIREYSTFLNNVRVDVWIWIRMTAGALNEEEVADNLVSKIHFTQGQKSTY